MAEILANGVKLETIDKVAFKGISENEEELYLLAKRKKEKFRVRVGVFQINMGVLGSFSIKDILIGLGIRSLGIVGVSQSKPVKVRVKCPHCQSIQKLATEWQKCNNCHKKFYLFDDSW